MNVASVNRIRLEKEIAASLATVWELWTTKEGIEQWWGPDGFRVEVKQLELRAGGVCEYAMIPVAPEMIAFMKSQGAPASNLARFTFAAIEPKTRLQLDNLIDFIPGEKPYRAQTEIVFSEVGGKTRVEMRIDPLHDELWTGRMKMGWEQELGKLARLFAKT